MCACACTVLYVIYDIVEILTYYVLFYSESLTGKFELTLFGGSGEQRPVLTVKV